jgi:hypothetical protein
LWRTEAVEGQVSLIEEAIEVKKVVCIGRKRVGRACPGVQLPEKSSNLRDRTLVVIEKLEGHTPFLLLSLDPHAAFSTEHLFDSEYHGPLPLNVHISFAVHLGLLRFPGRTLADVPDVPRRVVEYIAEQIGVDPNVFEDYGGRDNTIFEHLDELRREFGFQNCGWSQLHGLGRELLPLALESDRSFAAD